MATAAVRIPVELLVPIAIGRFLGPAAVGSYAMIFSVSAYIGYVADFGISYLLIREIARWPMETRSWIRSAFTVGGIVSLVLIGLVSIVALAVFGFAALSWEIICAVLSAIILSLANYYVSAFYANGRMQYETIGVLIQSLIYGALGFFVLINGWDLLFVFLSLLISRSLFFLVSRFLYQRMVRHIPDTKVKRTGDIRRESPAFLVHSLFSMVFTRIDILMLGAMVGPRQVGFYEPASGFVTRLPFVARALTNSSLPILSGLLPSQQDLARDHARTLSIRLLAISLPVGLWIFWAAHLLIDISYGPAFEPTALCLRILAVLIPLQFVDNALGMIATAGNKQRVRAKTVILASVVNITANVVMIPRFGYVATSVSSILSELVIFGLMLNCVRQVLKGSPFGLKDVASAVLGAASMILVLGLVSTLQVASLLKLTISLLSFVPCLVVYVWLRLIGPQGTAFRIPLPTLAPGLQIGKD